MIERTCGSRFLLEPEEPLSVFEGAGEYLYRHLAVKLQIARKENAPHCTVTHLALDPVSIREQRPVDGPPRIHRRHRRRCSRRAPDDRPKRWIVSRRVGRKSTSISMDC